MLPVASEIRADFGLRELIVLYSQRYFIASQENPSAC